MQTCVFCDVWGSAAYPEIRDGKLNEQIETLMVRLRERYHAQKFLVYFQSYTNTFMAVKKLEAYYRTALENKNVVGIVVGTRPDCLSPGLLELWKNISKETYLSIELGVQTFNDTFLDFLKRGHDSQCSLNAIHKIRDVTGVDLGLHYIFGNPGETTDDVVELARLTNTLPIHNVKLHNLHVLKNTTLEKYYNQGHFQPLELDAYAERVTAFIEHLSPQIAIQRLGAVSSRWDELVAPEWTRHKMRTHQFILDKMKAQNSRQGKFLT